MGSTNTLLVARFVGFQKLPESRNGFLVWFFFGGATLLGATRSETSGGTPLDLLETSCGALQVFFGGLPRIWAAHLMRILLCRVLSQSFSCGFWCGFSKWVFDFGFDFWVRFFAEGATPQNRAFFKKSNPKFEPKIQTPFPSPG